MASGKKEVLYALYNDETELISAIKAANKDHLDIMDVFTPFPIHGIDPLLGIEESRLHIVGFIAGAIGTLTAFGAMTWIFTRDWPTIFGGKPYWSVPAFIPITFELTVLFCAIAMVVTFYTVSGMGPGVTNPTLDDRITDDKFCLAFQTNGKSGEEVDNLKSFLAGTNPAEVNAKTL